jgi:hypothetical protein
MIGGDGSAGAVGMRGAWAGRKEEVNSRKMLTVGVELVGTCSNSRLFIVSRLGMVMVCVWWNLKCRPRKVLRNLNFDTYAMY